jgi:hypothetical protein
MLRPATPPQNQEEIRRYINTNNDSSNHHVESTMKTDAKATMIIHLEGAIMVTEIFASDQLKLGCMQHHKLSGAYAR